MEQAAVAKREVEILGFSDQCKVVCLEYTASCGGLNSIDAVRKTVQQELTIKKEDLQGFTDVASKFANAFVPTDLFKEELMECLDRLNNSLDQETFDECADSLVNPPVKSWEKVSMVLQLIYKACEQQDSAMVDTVVQIGVRYMSKTFADFVSSEGGWRSFGAPQSQEEQGDISSSIVVVPQSDAQETPGERVGAAAHVGDAPTPVRGTGSSAKEGSDDFFESPALAAPLDTPSPVNSDDERDSLATPPEIVERPHLTESYMGNDEIRRESNASGNNGFEIIESGNATETQVKSIIDGVQAFAQPEEKVEQEPLQPQKSEAGESLFGGYLPHIIIGIAAAAAGFFVLKRNL